MRFIALEVCGGVAALVFVTTLVATALHRSARGSEGTHQSAAVAEYLWAVVPWLMMAACVLPAVRRIVAGG
jgi:heme/copper-type cytochrome/quinol oxidase subunit 2